MKRKLNFPKPKILVTTTSFQDTPGLHHAKLKKKNWDVSFLRGPLKEFELIDEIKKYDGIICGDDEYTNKIIKIGKKNKLKVLSKYGVGLDKIDLDSAKKNNIIVSNCPGINQRSVAEHVIALIFTYEKNIHHQYNSVQKGSWVRLIGNEVRNKTIGIIGLGAIGKELCKIAVGVGLNVIVYDIKKDLDFLNIHNEIKFVSINELYENSDYISLHVPLNAKTKNMIDYEVMKKLSMKKPIIINTARAKLVVSKDILKAIKNKHISSYLCDVLENEPIEDNEILLNNKKIIITPHVGSRTYQNVEKQGEMAINNLDQALKF